MCRKEIFERAGKGYIDSRLSRFGDLPAKVRDLITPQRGILIEELSKLYEERGPDAIFVLFFLLVDPSEVEEKPFRFKESLSVPKCMSLQMVNGRSAYALSQEQRGNGRDKKSAEAKVGIRLDDEEVLLQDPQGDVGGNWNWSVDDESHTLSFSGEDVKSVFKMVYDGSKLEAGHYVVIPVNHGDTRVSELNIPVDVIKLTEGCVLRYDPISEENNASLSKILQFLF
jgi:hypothetical protein